ncbi:MAG TPA: hypothetical protein VE861_16005 [Gemmatimonadaceae bacterium]|nr:hypothetical protein [Gemmatimonadaceae bacterium]
MASLAFPSGVSVTTIPFDGGRGAVFDVKGAGKVAVTQAPAFPAYINGGVSAARDPYIAAYNRWCSVTIAGRPARLHLGWYVPVDPEGQLRVPVITEDVMTMLTNPDGRRMYVRIVREPFSTLRERDSLQIKPLLPVLASFEW